MAKTTQATTANQFGAGNLRITESDNKVTIEFDPSIVIGAFKAKADGTAGNPKVASTGSYRTLDVSGVRVMLHVIGRG